MAGESVNTVEQRPAASDAAPAEEREDRPLWPYAVLVAFFNLMVGGFLWALPRFGRGLPERMPAQDVLLLGVATHKLSRVLTKNRPTRIFRAPFTRYRGSAGRGEVAEEPEGTGMRRAIGELVTCPYCLGLWVAAAMSASLVVAPRTTRFFAAIMTVLGISDVLQIAQKAAQGQLE